MTNDSLGWFQIAILTAYSLGMACGQVLFKIAADRASQDQNFGHRLLDLVQNGYFCGALLLYAGFSIVWVWILTIIPLSRAYPFVALAFVLTIVLANVLFHEPLSWRLFGGVVMIICGLLLVTS
jgi:drug/metabolite transporter (DMT)-like permease